MPLRPPTPAGPALSPGRPAGPWRRLSAAGLLGATALLSTTLVSSAARAEGCQPSNGLSTCVDADNLWPHAGAGPFLSIGSTQTVPESKVSFGLVGSYLSRPIGLRVSSPDPAGATSYAIDNALDASFLFAVGITDRLELSAVAPITLFQNGDGLSGVLGTKDEIPRSVIRDLRFGLALGILRRPLTGVPRGAALTGRMDFAIPSASKGSFAGAATATAAPSLVFDYRLGRLDLSAELGARLRGESAVGNAVFGSQLSSAVGGSFDVLPAHLLTASAEVFALYGFSSQGTTAQDRLDGRASGHALVPAEWIVSASSAPLLGGDVMFTLGGGGTLPLSGEVGLTSPRVRVDFGVRYAPTGRDTDGDGVLDRDDLCPDVPEDRDGFEDTDGCPDPDNDKDGIPDVRDRCRDVAEDFDGFEDDDGCPDLDNDKDGIPDTLDKCPNGPEDFDGFKDDDGCPDPDNDLDGIPDENDKCPNAAEDFDGFEDTDGCPDPDNDEDGVLDKQDACPLEPETINGDKDDDGCPEPGARSLVRWVGSHIEVTGLGRFKPGSDKLTPELTMQAKMIAQILRGRLPLSLVILEAYGDRSGDGSPSAVDLAGRRAVALKGVLVASGIPAGIITAAAGDLAQKRDPKAPSIEVTARAAPRPGAAVTPKKPALSPDPAPPAEKKKP
jgi:outer membrane protein OmpA-like peptidoglycan-associated protein